ncbi:hypothetical protein ACFY8C_07340 [Streptomyces flavochromogenes]|uniref:Uncharacterized protein n=1 Tax=Streptomyces flavochromogenes TaxID=68199 RepID=A0ABW6XL70_9ACTN|nr:hypothetical protein [Streptomyces flavochromogenes]
MAVETHVLDDDREAITGWGAPHRPPRACGGPAVTPRSPTPSSA